VIPPDDITLTDMANSGRHTSPWRVFACHRCRIAWWHPMYYCPNCGTRLGRFPSQGYVSYEELAKALPDYKSGGQ
jgi:hypothetical protein